MFTMFTVIRINGWKNGKSVNIVLSLFSGKTEITVPVKVVKL